MTRRSRTLSAISISLAGPLRPSRGRAASGSATAPAAGCSPASCSSRLSRCIAPAGSNTARARSTPPADSISTASAATAPARGCSTSPARRSPAAPGWLSPRHPRLPPPSGCRSIRPSSRIRDMAILPAPTPILSAYAFSVPSEGFDEYLHQGTHLRAYCSLGTSFAATPLIVRGFKHEGWQVDCKFFAREPDGNSVPNGDLGAADFLRLHLIYRDPDGRRTTSITVMSTGNIERVELLDNKERVIAVRDREPFTFAAPT